MLDYSKHESLAEVSLLRQKNYWKEYCRCKNCVALFIVGGSQELIIIHVNFTFSLIPKDCSLFPSHNHSYSRLHSCPILQIFLTLFLYIFICLQNLLQRKLLHSQILLGKVWRTFCVACGSERKEETQNIVTVVPPLSRRLIILWGCYFTLFTPM